MRRLLLAVSLLVPLVTAPVAPARAQLFGLGGGGSIVTCLNCTDEPSTLAQTAMEAGNWITQLAHMVTTIENLIIVWQMLSGLTSVNKMAAILNTAAYFNAMGSFGNVPLMVQGGTSFGGLGNSYLAANTYYMPAIGSPIPQLNQLANLYAMRGNSLSNIQAIAATSLVTANAILAGLMALQQLIDLQPSNQFMAGLASRLHSFQGNIASQQWQLQQVQTFAAAQRLVFIEQEKQAVFCSAAGWSGNTQPLTVGLTVSGSGPCLTNGLTLANTVAAVPPALNTAVGALSLLGGALTLGGSLAGGGSGGVTDTGSFDTGDQGNLPTPPTPPAGGASGASAGDSSLPTPPIPPTDPGTDFEQDVTPSDNADTPATNNSCTSATGNDCTIPAQSASNLGCVETSDGGDCGGLTYDDTATFDPTVVPSAIPPNPTAHDGTAVTIQPGGDPSNVFEKDGPPTVMNSLPPPATLSGMAMVALLRQRRRKPEQLKDAA